MVDVIKQLMAILIKDLLHILSHFNTKVSTLIGKVMDLSTTTNPIPKKEAWLEVDFMSPKLVSPFHTKVPLPYRCI